MSCRAKSLGAAALWLWFSLLLTATVAAEEYDPFPVPKELFRESVRTIALWPVDLPKNIEDAKKVRNVLERRITTKLEAIGFKVIPSRVFGATWEQYAELAGGLFDPVTGESEEENVTMVRQLVTQELSLRHDADAFMTISLTDESIVVWAKEISRNDGSRTRKTIVWAAATEAVRWDGDSIEAFFRDRPERATGPQLGLRIYDPVDVELYNARMAIRWNRIYVNGNYQDRAMPGLLNSKKRLETVMDKLIEPLGEDGKDTKDKKTK